MLLIFSVKESGRFQGIYDRKSMNIKKDKVTMLLLQVLQDLPQNLDEIFQSLHGFYQLVSLLNN